jgi:hypothetical protein
MTRIESAEARSKELTALKAAAARQAAGVTVQGKKLKRPVPRELTQAAERAAAGKSPPRRGRKLISAKAQKKKGACASGDSEGLAATGDESEGRDMPDSEAPWAVRSTLSLTTL